MRSAVETGRSLWMQHRGFAWRPVNVDGRWLWLRPYWIVTELWGWGFSDQFTFAKEADADDFFDRRLR